MAPDEDIKAAKNIIQLLGKARKNLRLYPENNPIYAGTINEALERFNQFFAIRDSLSLRIRLYEIFYEDERVHHNTDQKNDNLSFFFYRDGIRELTFKEGLTLAEITSFLQIISMDFEHEVLEDDLVTLFWEKDFAHIRYVVEDDVLVDADYEAHAVQFATMEKTDPVGLKAAHRDALDGVKRLQRLSITPVSEKDLQQLIDDIKADEEDKTGKFMTILFDLLYRTKTTSHVAEIIVFIKSAVEYALSQGNLPVVVQTLARLRRIAGKDQVREDIRQHIDLVFQFMAGEPIIELLGRHLDSGLKPDPQPFQDIIRYLNKEAIVPLITVLAELSTIHARKAVIEALITLCPQGLTTVARGLSSPKWYVVRNIIYVLRENNDPRAVDYLLKITNHPDARVQKELLRALGSLREPKALTAIESFLDSSDQAVRLAAVQALAGLGTDAAKASLLARIASKSFNDKDFSEKKAFYQALTLWKDKEVMEYLMKVLGRAVLFGGGALYENKACAAYGLGLMGDAGALPLLFKYRGSSNKLLREAAETAIQRIENETSLQQGRVVQNPD